MTKNCISSCALLISRSQPKILRKIQKKLRRYISTISRFLHVWVGGAGCHKNDLTNFLAMSDHFLKVFFFKKNPPTILFYWWGQGSETLMWGVANFSGFAHSSLVFFSEADNFFLLKEYKRPVCNICCLCCLPLKILTLKPFLLCRNASAYNIQAPVIPAVPTFE